jgi:pentatricopeptide repeat protein
MLNQSQIVPDLSPTAIEYNSLINAWAKAGDPIAAEQVLRQMTDSQVQPDTISYTSVIQAWSQSGSAEAPERAQALLDDMEKSYRSQQQQQPQEQSNDTATRCKLQPDVRLYATIMNLFAKSRRPEQAQALYDKLKNRSDQEHLHKHSWIRPDLILFNSLLDAWAKVGNGQHAEQLLRNHVNGSSGFLPDTVSFNTVLAAWSRSQDDQAAPHAEAVFRWMQHLYQSQQLHCRPDSISFKSTMRAWSKSKQPDAFHRVLLLLSELQQHARSHNQQQQRRQVMQMDVETYVICLQALDRSQHLSNKEKTAHAQQLMHEMSQHGVQPTPQVLNLVGSCCQTQRRHQQRTDSNNSSNHDRPSQSKT